MLKKINLSDYKVFIYFILALLFVFSAVWGSALIDKYIIVTPTPTPSSGISFRGVGCPKEIEVYGELSNRGGQTVELISEPTSKYAKNGIFKYPDVVITKNETQESKIACGYLYVKAHTDKGALVNYENVYINPENFGGHINRVDQFGLGDGNNFSEYLFSLDDIKYWKTKNRSVVLEADWAALLNVNERLTFIIALNTQDQSGVIDKISIAYKCWNPLTGEENTGCKLTVED